MKHTVKQIEDQIETVEECLINLALLEVCDPVYSTILKTLRMLDTRLEEADEKKSHTDESWLDETAERHTAVYDIN